MTLSLLKKRLLLIFIGSFLTTSFAFAQLTGAQREAAVLEIFESSCALAGCHAAPVPQLNLDLTREQFYAGLVDVPAVSQPI